ncbi:Amino_acid transporter [Hexamita inflata]|uniref:Putative n=1 Tax=Hexamita inflata TaxID=28002 RepID=A0ABP1HX06_9EUKA
MTTENREQPVIIEENTTKIIQSENKNDEVTTENTHQTQQPAVEPNNQEINRQDIQVATEQVSVPEAAQIQQGVSKTPEVVATASIASSSFNLINTILGAGILTIPYCFSKTGWVVGIILQVATALISHYTFTSLCTGSQMSDSFDYSTIVKRILGRVAGYYSTFSLLIFTAFVMVSFCIITRDNLVFIHQEWAKMLVMWLVLLFLMMTLSLFKDINKLWITSFLAVVCVSYIFVFLIVVSILAHVTDIDLGFTRKPAVAFGTKILPYIQALATYSLCFCGHFNTTNIYAELKDRSPKKMNKVSAITAYSVLILNIGIGMGGYFIFTGDVLSDVLKSFESVPNVQLKPFCIIAHLCIIIVMICSYPLLCFCFRTTLNQIIFKNKVLMYKHQVIVVVTASLIFCLVASFLNDIGIVLDIASAIAGIPLVLVFPGFIQHKYQKRVYKEWDAERSKKQYRLLAAEGIFAFLVGCAGVIIVGVGISGSVTSIMKVEE